MNFLYFIKKYHFNINISLQLLFVFSTPLWLKEPGRCKKRSFFDISPDKYSKKKQNFQLSHADMLFFGIAKHTFHSRLVNRVPLLLSGHYSQNWVFFTPSLHCVPVLHYRLRGLSNKHSSSKLRVTSGLRVNWTTQKGWVR